MRECEGEELEHRLRRTSVIRDLKQVREKRICQEVRNQVRTPPAMCSRHRWSGHRTWHPRSGQKIPRAHHPNRASSTLEGTGPTVKLWGTPTQNKTPWTQSVRNNKRIKRGGDRSPTQGLAFGVRDACRAANLPLPKQCQFRPENAALQAQKLPISKTLATTGQICRGVDMASSYLWFRDADGGCSCPACLVERREYWSPNEVAVPGPGVGSANPARS